MNVKRQGNTLLKDIFANSHFNSCSCSYLNFFVYGFAYLVGYSNPLLSDVYRVGTVLSLFTYIFLQTLRQNGNGRKENQVSLSKNVKKVKKKNVQNRIQVAIHADYVEARGVFRLCCLNVVFFNRKDKRNVCVYSVHFKVVTKVVFRARVETKRVLTCKEARQGVLLLTSN